MEAAGVTHHMDLRCVDCQTRHYTAATRIGGRFARQLTCSECDGALAVVHPHEQSEVEEQPVELTLVHSSEPSRV